MSTVLADQRLGIKTVDDGIKTVDGIWLATDPRSDAVGQARNATDF
jgi:hypothetical protein